MRARNLWGGLLATWETLCAYAMRKAIGNYEIMERSDDRLTLRFKLEDERSQTVTVAHQEFNGSDWVEIATIVCGAETVDHRTVLEYNGTMVVGALGILEDSLVLKFPLLLSELDPPEFDVPLGIVAELGDMLEEKFTGADVF
jgi:hypothetical protein